MRFAAILSVSCLLIVACDASRPAAPGNPETPDSPVITTRDDIWSNIADSIKSGEVTTSTKLVLMVTHLRSVGKIADSDVAAIRSLFSDWDAKEFAVGQPEADKILTLPELKARK